MSDLDRAIASQAALAVSLSGSITKLDLAKKANAFLGQVRDAVEDALDGAAKHAPEMIAAIVQGVAEGLIKSAVAEMRGGK